jgi:hypothetical protein
VSLEELEEILFVCFTRGARSARCEEKEEWVVGLLPVFMMAINPIDTIGRPIGQLRRLIELNDSMGSRSTDTKGVDACSADGL